MCPTTFEEAIPWILTFVSIAVMVGIASGYFTAVGLYKNERKNRQ